MGLTFPADLAAWQRWQNARQSWPRRLRRRVRRAGPVRLAVAPYVRDVPGVPDGDTARDTARDPARNPAGSVVGAPQVLVALDSRSPTSVRSLLAPLGHLRRGAAVLERAADGPTGSQGGGQDSRRASSQARIQASGWTGEGEVADVDLLADVRCVVALGNYMEVGAAAHRFARRRGLPFVVVQHGLVTPLAPPLPPQAHLLAWTEADAAYWSAGRPDVTSSVVGSQLLWEAAAGRGGGAPLPDAPGPDAPLVYLGQLHGAELPRAELAAAARSFCLAHQAVYRPHPSERDRLSRWTHARWRRAGLRIDDSGGPLAELAAPVVSVFSTGVLEAAARGLPAWVDFPAPPPWLAEFWERYRMHRYGGEPTPAPQPADAEPAGAIARFLEDL